MITKDAVDMLWASLRCVTTSQPFSKWDQVKLQVTMLIKSHLPDIVKVLWCWYIMHPRFECWIEEFNPIISYMEYKRITQE